MAVTSLKRIHQGRASSTTLQRSGIQRIRYTDIYRAETDDNFTEPETVKADSRCPKIGQPMLRDPRAYCQLVNAVNESFSKQVFLITVGYSTERELAENPLQEPARITWHTEQYQEPVMFDRNRVAHTNSARDYFDPPAMMTVNRWVAVTQKNVAVVPVWYLTYADSVNSAAWAIDGVTVARGFARLVATTIGEEQERNNIVFRVLTMTFQFATLDSTAKLIEWDGTSAYVALGGADYHHAHAIMTVNAGMKKIESSEKRDCVDTKDMPATVPMLLQADGDQFTPATVKPSDALFIVSDVYPEKNFSVLPVA
jgi:hypothetical protein